MNVTEFSERVTQGEGKLKSLSIAQVKEVLRVVNELLEGRFYAIIRELAQKES